MKANAVRRLRRWSASLLIAALGIGPASAAMPGGSEGTRMYAQEQNESVIIVPAILPWTQMQDAFGARTAMPALKAGAIVLDGELDEWAGYAQARLPDDPVQIELSGWAGEQDLSASVYTAYDADYFYWAAAVRDDVHEPVAGSTMWRGDSVQFAFGLDGAYGPEYAVSLGSGGVEVARFSDGAATGGAELVEAAVARDGGVTSYEVRLPWTAIASGPPSDGRLPFTLLINDNDGAGRRGWIEWTPGIGKAKDPALHAELSLIDPGDNWSMWVEGPRQAVVGEPNTYTVQVVNWSGAPVALAFASDAMNASAAWELPAHASAELSLSYTATAAGVAELDFAVAEAGGPEAVRTVALAAALSAQDIGELLDGLEAELPALELLLTQAEAEGLASDYERVNYTVIADFIGYGRDDIAHGRLPRAQYVAESLRALYDEAEATLNAVLTDTAEPVAAPRYVTGPYTLSGYSFLGDTTVRSSGVTEERPIFFTGYGHFGQVRTDIPKFQDLGANIIQIELGPRDVMVDNRDYLYGYSVHRSGGAEATASYAEGISHSGARSLQLDNASPYQSNVFINVTQTLAVEPDTTYVFSAWVKGEDAHNVWFPGGEGWKKRQSFPSGTYDWTQVTTTYTTGPEATTFPLVLLSENAGTIYIDDLSAVKVGDSVNLVQNPGFEELGGYDPSLEYAVTTTKIDSDIRPVLQRAADHDVAVNLLISPHYFPAWALERWPELNVPNGGGIKYSIFHPKAQAIIEGYLEALIPAVKDYASLHSITLSNEPTYDARVDPYALPAWHAYLSEVYGSDIAELNAAYQSAYADFDEVPMLGVTGANRPTYDYVRFNQNYFASWHEWMADLIHELAPGLPVHAKIMGDPKGSLAWGIDVERFSELSQINGNDNWNYIHEGAKGFMEELSFYDMQASFRTAPVFNSEHHVIADGDGQYVPEQARHVRASLWQSAIHGRSASTFWIWERTYNPAASREGSILHRPDVVAEIGHTNLDLNRLAEEVTAFQHETPRVAILYSTASGVYAPDYHQVLLRAYEALAYSGMKVGFVSERQAAEGALDDYALLVVPRATHVEADTLTAIRAFSEQGGAVLLVGEDALSLRPDGGAADSGHLAAVQAEAVTVASNRTAAQLREDLRPLLAAAAPDRLEVVSAASLLPSGSGAESAGEVSWRSVIVEGRTLLNVIHYGAEPVTAAVIRDGERAVAFDDLLGGDTVGAELTLEPMTPYLLEATDWEALPCNS
ncbi:beta-galactosidase [Paenibacillus sp. IB182496]|uniref:Beta-galactosidase n=1 Tax=Paenibacillus sabuli TaxID=2772509 RepID=A0A927GTX7_9BACL|nr:sugar-binding protein [Paenibacillus sabuli]MBD2847771.1 beta-galactosidase [Paenibacillus sabuli]